MSIISTRKYSAPSIDLNMPLRRQARPVMADIHKKQVAQITSRLAKAMSATDIINVRFEVRKALISIRELDKIYNPPST